MCDANAAIGGYDTADNVCGKFGNSRQDTPGLRLRQLLAMYEFCAPVTWTKQSLSGTWMHPRYLSLHQCDNIFVKNEQRHLVNKCWNSDMLTRSDHMSMRVNYDLQRIPLPKRTTRSKRLSLNFEHLFSPNKAQHTCDLINAKLVTPRSKYKLNTILNDLIKALPKTLRPQSGWYDTNKLTFAPMIEDRNVADRAYAISKTPATRLKFRKADKILHAAMTKAENEWWITNLDTSTRGPLRSPHQLWKSAQHALRGGDKWKRRHRAFVRNKLGIQATTIHDNVANVCDYFSGVYNFKSRPAGLLHLPRVNQTKADRSYLSPRDFEVKRAIQALRHKAPGLDGLPIIIWKALATDKSILKVIGDFFRECWDNEAVPESWLVGYMLVLPKKGDPTLAKNLRLILVEASESKIYQWILNQRLNAYYETFAPEFSNGFHSGRGTSDANFIFKTVLRKRKEHNLESWVLFLDIVKSFGAVDRTRLWTILSMLGIPHKMSAVFRSLFKKTR